VTAEANGDKADEGYAALGAVARVPSLILGATGAVTLFAMMALTFVNVFGRYLFNSPINGGEEIVAIMMGLIIFAVLPLLSAREGHVTIDIFDGVTPRNAKLVQRLLVNLVAAAVLAVIAWQLYVRSFDLAKNNEVWMTLKIRHAPFAVFFAVMAALSALACLANGALYLAGRRDPERSAL
jgi:TRAP-type C4-dicarboxylate transport system permease small subunit